MAESEPPRTCPRMNRTSFVTGIDCRVRLATRTSPRSDGLRLSGWSIQGGPPRGGAARRPRWSRPAWPTRGIWPPAVLAFTIGRMLPLRGQRVCAGGGWGLKARSACASERLAGECQRFLPRSLTQRGAVGSGFQPAMVRTCARAFALSVIPGNRRRSSIAADSSPSWLKMARIAAASASVMRNIPKAW
jgi:hypothetical protein